jgi:DNA-binding LacI/PurR family transcriptional regulator
MDTVKAAGGASATIYDVALRAGVSISTVSLALNSPDRVKPKTHQRIMEAIDDLGFTPKAEAVIRARRGTGRIGIIAPFTSFPTETSLRLKGVLQGAAPHGHEVVVFDQASAATSRLMSLPVTRKVDGLIIVSVPFDDAVRKRLSDHGTPIVVVEIPHESTSSVLIDHRGGGALVGEFLMGRGHERMAYIGHRQDHDYPSQSREKGDGFASVLTTPPQICNVENTLRDAIAAGIQLLRQPEPPTAFFAHDDLLAAGIVMAARQLGLRIPEDVAVVGFNDTDIAEPLGLTTVRQPFVRSGELAVQMLIDQITTPNLSQQTVTLGVDLIERSTV